MRISLTAVLLSCCLVACGADDANEGNDTDDVDESSDGGSPDGPSDSLTQFAEVDGYVVMEMESVAIPTNHEWIFETELADYTGRGYYRFTGNGICNGPANGPLRYTFSIGSDARYELRLRAARIAHCVAGEAEQNGTCVEDNSCTSLGVPIDGSCGVDECIRTDISNDAFVRIEDIEGNSVAFVDQPADTIGEGVKLFGGGTAAWNWTGRNAMDPGGPKLAAHWDLPVGNYALIIEGRSQAFRIDRIVLFDESKGTTDGAVDRPETLAP